VEKDLIAARDLTDEIKAALEKVIKEFKEKHMPAEWSVAKK